MSRKSKSRGLPVDVFGFDDSSDDPRKASGAAFSGDLFALPTSKKERQKAAAAKEAATAAAAAAAAAAKGANMARRLSHMLTSSPSSWSPSALPAVTCETCKRPKLEGDLGWKESTLGFSSQGICPVCARVAKPLSQNPKLMWDTRKPDILSARHAKLTKASHKFATTPDALKAKIVASSALYNPLSHEERLRQVRHGMREKLIEMLATPPEGMHLTPAEMIKLKESMDKRGGTRRKSKSKSRTKSKSKSKSRF